MVKISYAMNALLIVLWMIKEFAINVVMLVINVNLMKIKILNVQAVLIIIGLIVIIMDYILMVHVKDAQVIVQVVLGWNQKMDLDALVAIINML
jgi:hypothetical protein